ncbi:MAG: energy transducer TonB [Sneathiella sp.]|nr:energy transducer TonB [Sneathiella sp.]
MTIRFYHWIIAVVASLLLHVLFIFDYDNNGNSNAAKDLGVGGFEVAISMQMATAGADVSGEAESQPKEETLVPEIADAIEPEPIPEPVREELPTPVEPEKDPIEESDIEIAEVAEIVPPPEVTPPTPKVRPKQVIQEKPKPIEPQKVAEVKSAPKPVAPEPKVNPSPVSPQKSPSAAEQKTAAASALISGGVSSNAPAANRTDTANAEGGGKLIGTATPNYISEIREWLERHKTYPKKAKRRRQQGVVTLYFSIDKMGRVLKYEIRGSSGVSSLDKATVAMLEKANPLPPFPKSMGGDYLEFTLPVSFNLSN